MNRTLKPKPERTAPDSTPDAAAPAAEPEEDWENIPELDPVDQYVIAHGEYPMSGDTVGPDIVDDTLLEAFTQPDDRPASKERIGEK